MSVRRLDVVFSVGTRIVQGAFPVALVMVFGWTYGREAFDAVAAAANWANYLNLFLLSGFVLVPPAVARLRAKVVQGAERTIVRDHLALMRWLLAAGASAALPSWLLIGWVFPELALRSGDCLAAWYPLLALLTLSQIPLALWLGVAQAAGLYRASLAWVALPRTLALAVIPVAAQQGVGSTTVLALAVGFVLVGQSMIYRSARRALAAVDAELPRRGGRATAVLLPNLSAGAISLVGVLVTILPVTMVGHVAPSEVGNAHVIVTLSNAMGAVIVAAFFPLSLTIGRHIREPGGLRAHIMRVAGGVALITFLLITAAWLFYAVCVWMNRACTAELFIVGSLVLLGAGLRLGSLGIYHAAVYVGRPYIALPSACIEALTVVMLTGLLVPTVPLAALGIAFAVGGGLRLILAFWYETRRLARSDA